MQILIIIHVLVAIAMVAFVLVQRGPGATAGAAFGSGASGTVFGSRGAGSFLSRTTWVLAGLFCLISLSMAVWVSRDATEPEMNLGVMDEPTAQEQPIDTAPVDTPSLSDSDQGSDLPSLDTSGANESGDMPRIEQGESGGEEPGEGTGSGG
ncbi:MAG: preprotein translocase subunit SecG [Xanthomonadales bacterium]|nr:preprotein translocase subunit SecG [Xanthomonadales bacterium]NIX13715.1 preprotein translocase subunit SecG [Xanthomonadales bacterium]